MLLVPGCLQPLESILAGPAGPGCSASIDETDTPPVLLSANFGLDNVPTAMGFNVLCGDQLAGTAVTDGMPVVTSVLVDPASLDVTDFEVVTASGAVLVPECVTLNPANDDCEGRTILLAGQLGDDETDPPVFVRIVGELLTLDGRDFRHTAEPVAVTPLDGRPSLVMVERVNPDDVQAPAGTAIALRAVWGGGVTAIDGNEVTAAEWGAYRLTYIDEDGNERIAAPIDIGDLNDFDNNHLLFFADRGQPLSLFLPSGLVTDPNDDVNDDTSSSITDARSGE
jgi:hypothetical protein